MTGETIPRVDDEQWRLSGAQRARLALLADELIPGGLGLPSASAAKVHEKWIDKTLKVRPDLISVVSAVIDDPGDPRSVLEQLHQRDRVLFGDFTLAIAGAYFMNPRVRKLLSYPWAAPAKTPALPDEAEVYLEDGILDPVIQRGQLFP